MRKILIIFIIAAGLAFSLFYFKQPLVLLRPVFHADTIRHYAGRYGFDPLLVTALIKTESNFFRRARSHRGAIGLMQLMPATAKELARELGYPRIQSSDDLEDPDINIHLGTYYLSKLRDEFAGNEMLALAAYNAGASKVGLWHNMNPLMTARDIPYRETRNYVKGVQSTYQCLKKIQKLKNLIRPWKA